MVLYLFIYEKKNLHKRIVKLIEMREEFQFLKTRSNVAFNPWQRWKIVSIKAVDKILPGWRASGVVNSTDLTNSLGRHARS